MDKFDKILRDKLTNHDSGMDHGAWEKFSQNFNQADSFDNAVRQKLENHDAGAGMENAAWNQLAQQLNPVTASWKYYLTGGIAAAVIGVGIYYFSGSNETTPSLNNNVKDKSEVIAKNNNNDEKVSPVDGGSESVTITYGNDPVVISDNNKDAVVNNNNHNDVIVNNKDSKKDDVLVVNNDLKKDNRNDVKDVNNTNNPNINKDIKNDIKKDDNKQVNTNEATVTLVKPEFSTETEVCQNGELKLKSLNNADYATTWLLNGEEVSTNANPILQFNKAGQQQVQLIYTAIINGKRISTESEKTIINVLPAPDAAFEIIKSNLESIPEYTLTSENADNVTYVWNFGDGQFSIDEKAVHVYKKKGTYAVSLTANAKNGCQAKVSNKVDIRNDYNLLAPTAFTPGGDGINETFMPAALTIMDNVKFKMSIMDRSGKIMYQTSNVSNPWDGMNVSNGQKCASAVYVWRVELTLPNGQKDEYMGHVLLNN